MQGYLVVREGVGCGGDVRGSSCIGWMIGWDRGWLVVFCMHVVSVLHSMCGRLSGVFRLLHYLLLRASFVSGLQPQFIFSHHFGAQFSYSLSTPY